MIIKRIACWRLAGKYNLAKLDILLPTGCDCIIEEVLRTEGIRDSYGGEIELVHKDMQYILWLAVPVIGLSAIIFRTVWRYKVLYAYLSKVIYPSFSDWQRLLLVIVPSLFYLKLWFDLGNESKDNGGQ